MMIYGAKARKLGCKNIVAGDFLKRSVPARLARSNVKGKIERDGYRNAWTLNAGTPLSF
jgi:hypothetical protein